MSVQRKLKVVTHVHYPSSFHEMLGAGPEDVVVRSGSEITLVSTDLTCNEWCRMTHQKPPAISSDVVLDIRQLVRNFKGFSKQLGLDNLQYWQNLWPKAAK